LAHDVIQDGFIPSPLSCVLVCPAPPVGTHPPLQLPCWNDTPCFDHLAEGDGGPGFAWSYWRHSHQSVAFEPPADLSPAPDTTPAATLLARLVGHCSTAVTWVGR